MDDICIVRDFDQKLTFSWIG